VPAALVAVESREAGHHLARLDAGEQHHGQHRDGRTDQQHDQVLAEPPPEAARALDVPDEVERPSIFWIIDTAVYSRNAKPTVPRIVPCTFSTKPMMLAASA
jgi:hypothetical protein